MLEPSQIKEFASGLGLRLGICEARRPPHYDAYTDWVAQGSHGEMAYLARHLALKAHPNNLLEGCASVVAVALNYNQPNPVLDGQVRIARYALGRDYHKVLRSKLSKLVNFLKSCWPDAGYRICVDSAPLMERDYAHLAGLGWFGKNTCLIDSRTGSWFVLGMILTTIDLPVDAPAIGNCGTCQRCIEACPTGAIVFREGRWQILGPKCISYQTIEKRGPLEVSTAGWTFGCDICQEVCPFNQQRSSQPMRAGVTQEQDFLERREWPTLAEIVNLPYERWDNTTAGSPVRRAGFEGLKRNARANLTDALGNYDDPQGL